MPKPYSESLVVHTRTKLTIMVKNFVANIKPDDLYLPEGSEIRVWGEEPGAITLEVIDPRDDKPRHLTVRVTHSRSAD